MAYVTMAVYTIFKNESKFVKGWMESMWNNGKGADAVYVLDTGSTDGSFNLFKRTAREMKIPRGWLNIKKKKYKQFRFDVARNDNLDMITKDYDALVSVDLDERLTSDFWADARECIREHPDFCHLDYLYAWNHDENGENGRTFWYDKVHKQKGYRYKCAVHEYVYNVDPEIENNRVDYAISDTKVYLHHFPDRDKPRGQYLKLLKIRCKEDPDDVYGFCYLAREYFYHNPKSFKGLMASFWAYLRCTDKMNEEQNIRSYTTQMIATYFRTKNMLDEAEFFYLKAIEYNRQSRDPYIEYALMKAYQGDARVATQLIREMVQDAPEPQKKWWEYDYDFTWRPFHVLGVAFCWDTRYEDALRAFKTADDVITTEKDKQEAKDLGFYSDYQWLLNKMISLDMTIDDSAIDAKVPASNETLSKMMDSPADNSAEIAAQSQLENAEITNTDDSIVSTATEDISTNVNHAELIVDSHTVDDNVADDNTADLGFNSDEMQFMSDMAAGIEQNAKITETKQEERSTTACIG